MAATPHTPEDVTANERRALIRQLTNGLNQRELDRRDHNENFRRYGVLLEGIYQQLEDQNEMLRRILTLGMFWTDKENAHE